VADYLDRETARLEALIAVTQQMLLLLAERWETQRIALVSGTSGSAEQLGTGPEWLGRVPSSWSIERLKFLARMESGHTPDRKVDAYWVDCTIPWITLNDVGTLQREWTITESANAINELGMANSAAHILSAGTVVLSRDATVGRAAILGRPMTVSQHFVGWTCGPRLAPEYLLHVLRGPMQRHFATLTAGATIATIGMPELNDLVVPVPSSDEQARIVAKLRSAEDQFERARAALDSRVGLLQERRQSLITAAVTGQLDLQDAA
jgi:type I restriction enzyme S subunit